ncbi:molybdopterin converting factor subunit 1 [Sulfurivirga sp.]|uniref:molybdopterin converting factor subunit 1 n=1 Tax=Sulfurivirga sp. TaxID=2614236 RepID=UPI0025F89E68|nr:molybdopterin converting factor subunit 1 [Sulfurivirga sp.]
MIVNILYFASLREQLGTANEQFNTDAATVGELLDQLCARGPRWQQALCDNSHLQMAVDQTVAHRDTPLRDGAEVAFFPPVTGG